MSDKAMELEQRLREQADFGGVDGVGSRLHENTDVYVTESEMLALADTLAAGRVFLKLREAWAKRGGQDLFQALSPGGGHAHLGHVVFRESLDALEGTADGVLGKETA